MATLVLNAPTVNITVGGVTYLALFDPANGLGNVTAVSQITDSIHNGTWSATLLSTSASELILQLTCQTAPQQARTSADTSTTPVTGTLTIPLTATIGGLQVAITLQPQVVYVADPGRPVSGST